MLPGIAKASAENSVKVFTTMNHKPRERVSIEPRLFSHGDQRAQTLATKAGIKVSIEPRLFSHGDLIPNKSWHDFGRFQLSHDFSAMETSKEKSSLRSA